MDKAKAPDEATADRGREELYQALFEQASDGILISDGDGHYLEANPQACAMLGYSREELLMLSWEALIPAEDLAHDPLRRADLRAGKHVLKERRLRAKDGRLVPIETSARMLSNNTVLAIVRNISERKRTEETLRKQAAVIDAIFNQAVFPFALLDSEHRFIRVNAAYAQHFQKKIEDFIGNSYLDFLPDDEDYRKSSRAILDTVVRTGQPSKIFARPFVFPGQSERGVTYWDWILQPIVDEQGELELLFFSSNDVTERVRVEESLREREAKYRALIQKVPVAIVLHDGQGRIMASNSLGQHLLGYSEDQLFGKPLADSGWHFVREDGSDLPVAEYPVSLVISTRQPLRDYVVGIQAPQQAGTLWALVNAEPEYDAAGELAQIIVSFIDITERKKAERERIDHLRFFETLDQINRMIQGASTLDQMMSGVLDIVLRSFDCDRAWLVYPCDPQAASWQVLMEHTRPEYSGANALGAEIPISEEVAASFQIVRASKGPVRFGPGTEHPLPPDMVQRFGFQSFIAMALYPKLDKPWEFGLHQCRYPRAWTEAEEWLFQEIGRRLTDGLTSLLAYRNLQEGERRRQLALHIGHIGTFEADLASGRGTWSPELAEIWGIPDGFTGDFVSFAWEHVHPDDLACVREAFAQIEQSREDQEMEFRIIRPDGAMRWIRWRGQVLPDSATGSGRVVGVNMDITARKRAEEAQAKLEAQLRQAQKMESIGQLAGGVAHDFNNLLTVIQGYGDLLQTEVLSEETRREMLGQILRASEHAAALTRQLLAFSRQQILSPALLDLNELVINLYKMLRRLIGEDIMLTTALQAGLWLVTADPGQIEQIMMNLVINARDAMPTGGQLSIETSNVQLDQHYATTHLDVCAGPYVMLAISDTGHGMDAQTITRIFDPFFTTKSPGKGTGLGLATVYGIVKQSGGHIIVYSEPGLGSSFKLYLPASDTTSAGLAAPLPHTGSRGGDETILLVEDEEVVRHLVQLALQDLGYTVLEARSSEDAIELAQQHYGQIDLLLTDVIMPQLSGRELAERLKQLCPQLKVLFMSGYTDDAVVRHGVLVAEIAFISKPFTPGQLAAKVREVLES